MTRCSVASAEVGESLSGTAPVARAWIVVEHPGPWGRDAIADSRLPDDVRVTLLTAKAHGVSVLLARHPDRPERAGHAERNVWVARPGTGGLLMRHAVLDGLDRLASWDLAAIAGGSLPAVGSVTPEPLTLVCTHGRRDQCCARNGRALLNGLLEDCRPDQRSRVWECSHVGGHRFSPVTVSLPSGAVHGRVPLPGADLLAASEAGRVLPGLLRGRSALPEPLQAAEGAVRMALGCDGSDDLDTLMVLGDRAVPATATAPVGDRVVGEVRHRDGRAWRIEAVRVPIPVPRPESCGAEPAVASRWACTAPVPTTPWS